MCYFTAARALFILCCGGFQGDVLKSFLYGLWLDGSATGYFLWSVLLLGFIQLIWKSFPLKKVLHGIFLLMLLLTTIIIFTDLLLYPAWGFRCDLTPLIYLTRPKESLSFGSMSQLLPLVLGGILWFVFWIWIYKKYLYKNYHWIPEFRWRYLPYWIGCVAIVFLPIRGGVGVSAMGLSKVYYSNQVFSNHAAINVIWNVIFHATEGGALNQKFHSMPDDLCTYYMQNLYPVDTIAHLKPFKIPNPNVILILLESFTSGIVEKSIEGNFVTPNLNRWITQSCYWENMYATGDRTDKGLIGVFSGFPAQPKSSIINFPGKTQSLPGILRDAKTHGCSTAFFYGGDITFANQKSYLVQQNLDTLIDKLAFDPATYNAKWGVHDHILYNRVLESLPQFQRPFFTGIMTLSSHEPFDVPHQSPFHGTDVHHRFMHSAHYADSSLGYFLDALHNKPIWDSTIVVIVADHGVRYVNKCTNMSPVKFRIPCVITGGALDTAYVGKRIGRIVSQTDIAGTLSKHLFNTKEHYPYSNDLFSTQAPSFAWYAYNNGFGFITDTCKVVYDNDSRRMKQRGCMNKKDCRQGKAYLQSVIQSFHAH